MWSEVDHDAEVLQVAGDPSELVAIAAIVVELPGEVEFRIEGEQAVYHLEHTAL
jgi:hypothetical protein